MYATKQRIPECEGIYGAWDVQGFDHQDKSRLFLRMPLIYKWKRLSIESGRVLEAGCGPGVLGLNLLRFIRTKNIKLFAIDISQDMIEKAKNNAFLYNLGDSAFFINCQVEQLPFADKVFDAVITNGSLHHWLNPQRAFLELERVLKPNGKIFINDTRRDASLLLRLLVKTILTRWQRRRFDDSFKAGYTIPECERILESCGLKGWHIRKTILEFEIRGTLYKV